MAQRGDLHRGDHPGAVAVVEQPAAAGVVEQPLRDRGRGRAVVEHARLEGAAGEQGAVGRLPEAELVDPRLEVADRRDH